jgi:TRAP-type C4-dicarboxylate transport system substrate-binding protein
VTSIVMNADAFEALASAQRDALRAAAPAAVAPMTRRLASEEDRALHILCRPPHGDENLFNLSHG